MGSPNTPCAWYWFNCLYSLTCQSIEPDWRLRIARVRRGFICRRSIVTKMEKLVTGGGEFGSDQGGVSCLTVWC